MHVLVIPSWYPTSLIDVGGSFFREQALALHRNGCKVGVIYPQMRSLREWKTIFKGSYAIENELDEGITTLRHHGMCWFPRMRKCARKQWVNSGMKLYKEYVRINGEPDLIHAHSILNAGVLAGKIKATCNVPYVVTEHSSIFGRNLALKDDLMLAKSVSENSEKNLGVSTKLCSLLDSVINADKKWTFLPNIVNNNFFSQEILIEEGDKFTFINVALCNENKRQKDIILAFSESFKKYKNVNLVISGDGPELLNLKILASDLGIRDRVEFTGMLSRDQVRQKIAQSSAFVLSSLYETFGVVIIEALALGLPVIATRCGGPESIVRKKDGLLVPVDDLQSLGNAMREVYENWSSYDRHEIRKSCWQRFSEKVIAEKLMKIYLEVVG